MQISTIVAPQSGRGFQALIQRLEREELEAIPGCLARALQAMAATLDHLQAAIRKIEREILVWLRQDADARRLVDRERPSPWRRLASHWLFHGPSLP